MGSSASSQLLAAASVNDTKGIEQALTNGANIDTSVDDSGRTALMIAAEKGQVGAVKLLLEHGAQLEIKCTGPEQTALLYAADSGHEKIVKALLLAGADANARDKVGKTPLMHAAFRNFLETAEVLLTVPGRGNKAGPRGVVGGIDVTDDAGGTALAEACRRGHLLMARMLLVQGGADARIADKEGRSCLMLACERAKVALAALLLDEELLGERRAVLDARARDGGTALMHAAQTGELNLVRILLDHGADAEVKDFRGWDAAEFAARNKHRSVQLALQTHSTSDTRTAKAMEAAKRRAQEAERARTVERAESLVAAVESGSADAVAAGAVYSSMVRNDREAGAALHSVSSTHMKFESARLRSDDLSAPILDEEPRQAVVVVEITDSPPAAMKKGAPEK